MNGRGQTGLGRTLYQIGGLLLVAGVGGCGSIPQSDRGSDSAREREGIYDRMKLEYAAADLLKPAESGQTNTLAFALAPLIIRELSGAEANAEKARRDSTETSFPRVVTDRFVRVEYLEEKVAVRGRLHDRLTYLWGAADRGQAGIRITLDRAGQPVVWEILADSTGMEIVCVSQSLEISAAAEFGAALPGRRFVIEREMDKAKDVIVARVIEDGQVPMGPIVHWSAGTGDIGTVICRCMPIQVRQLVRQGFYELSPVRTPNPAGSWCETRRRILGGPESERKVPELPLEELLRIPSAF
jgi:hypothetical protein